MNHHNFGDHGGWKIARARSFGGGCLQRREAGAVVVDPRRHEWDAGHAAAPSISRGIIESVTYPTRDRVILYCGGGYRSALQPITHGWLHQRVVMAAGGRRGGKLARQWKLKNLNRRLESGGRNQDGCGWATQRLFFQNHGKRAPFSAPESAFSRTGGPSCSWPAFSTGGRRRDGVGIDCTASRQRSNMVLASSVWPIVAHRLAQIVETFGSNERRSTYPAPRALPRTSRFQISCPHFAPDSLAACLPGYYYTEVLDGFRQLLALPRDLALADIAHRSRWIDLDRFAEMRDWRRFPKLL